jgi:hypothetical protein
VVDGAEGLVVNDDAVKPGLGGLDVPLVEGEDRRVVLRVLLVAGPERIAPGDARTVD